MKRTANPKSTCKVIQEHVPKYKAMTNMYICIYILEECLTRLNPIRDLLSSPIKHKWMRVGNFNKKELQCLFLIAFHRNFLCLTQFIGFRPFVSLS